MLPVIWVQKPFKTSDENIVDLTEKLENFYDRFTESYILKMRQLLTPGTIKLYQRKFNHGTLLCSTI
jgi:hypothetical protein